jgi:hypothetical protein
MQAAEFMGCEEAQEDIIKSLQTLLIEMIERTKKIIAPQPATLNSILSQATDHAYTHHTHHHMQVCACVALLVLSEIE